MVEFIVNGQNKTVAENKKLMDYLRDELGLTSVKDGCSEGACGTCTVLVDHKAVKACLFDLEKIQGKEILTVEGLSAREKEVYSYAFAKCGAVQCGFCIPGMVISAKALLDQNADPTKEEIKKAIQGNICRCTGYKKIEQAIAFAAKLLREDTPVEKVTCKGLVGESMPRIDARGKVLGEAEYANDMRAEGMLYGGALRIPHARALIKKIDISKVKTHPEVECVVTAEDIPGKRFIGHIKKDWPVFIAAGEETRYVGDALVAIAARTKAGLKEALDLVEVDYEVLTPITSPQDGMREDAYKIHEQGNILSKEVLRRGQVEEALQRSKHVVTNRYSVPFTEHAFLETESALSIKNGDELTIYSTFQGVYDIQRECAEVLGIAPEKVRAICRNVGGGFGGKEDITVQHHSALLCWLTGKPVNVTLSRKESIHIHPKRHAMEMEFTTACDENGILTAMKAEIISDTGAYASLGGPVLQRACTHAAGPYNYQNMEVTGIAVYTNNPPAGAYRGFGVTQSAFANECNINQLAELTGLSHWEIRHRNAIRPGQVLPNGQIAGEDTALVETLEAIKPFYDSEKLVGIACAFKNSGIGVGLPDIGRCRLTVDKGKLRLRSGAVCIGQGMGTILVQMLAETTGFSPEDIIYDEPDTFVTPNSGMTTASRQTLFTGEAVVRAGKELMKALASKTIEELDGQDFLGEYFGETDPMGSPKENPKSHIAYGYATHVVALNEEGKLKKVVAAHDVGRAINPVSLEGQIEGGVVMSLGYALTEDFPLKDGVPQAKFGTLGLFRSTQVPELESIIIEKNLESDLAFGAKGIGEISSIPTAPAVQGAYMKYDGHFRKKLPLENTPYSKKR